ncbi:hypothetical protein BN1110_04874 [bacterium YEK0313]|nr:hypothetical protein BN1110_04874 [bacterium YEK0313]
MHGVQAADGALFTGDLRMAQRVDVALQRLDGGFGLGTGLVEVGDGIAGGALGGVERAGAHLLHLDEEVGEAALDRAELAEAGIGGIDLGGQRQDVLLDLGQHFRVVAAAVAFVQLVGEAAQRLLELRIGDGGGRGAGTARGLFQAIGNILDARLDGGGDRLRLVGRRRHGLQALGEHRDLVGQGLDRLAGGRARDQLAHRQDLVGQPVEADLVAAAACLDLIELARQRPQFLGEPLGRGEAGHRPLEIGDELGERIGGDALGLDIRHPVAERVDFGFEGLDRAARREVAEPGRDLGNVRAQLGHGLFGLCGFAFGNLAAHRLDAAGQGLQLALQRVALGLVDLVDPFGQALELGSDAGAVRLRVARQRLVQDLVHAAAERVEPFGQRRKARLQRRFGGRIEMDRRRGRLGGRRGGGRRIMVQRALARGNLGEGRVEILVEQAGLGDLRPLRGRVAGGAGSLLGGDAGIHRPDRAGDFVELGLGRGIGGTGGERQDRRRRRLRLRSRPDEAAGDGELLDGLHGGGRPALGNFGKAGDRVEGAHDVAAAVTLDPAARNGGVQLAAGRRVQPFGHGFQAPRHGRQARALGLGLAGLAGNDGVQPLAERHARAAGSFLGGLARVLINAFDAPRNGVPHNDPTRLAVAGAPMRSGFSGRRPGRSDRTNLVASPACSHRAIFANMVKAWLTSTNFC